jgi:hypothetical protein
VCATAAETASCAIAGLRMSECAPAKGWPFTLLMTAAASTREEGIGGELVVGAAASRHQPVRGRFHCLETVGTHATPAIRDHVLHVILGQERCLRVPPAHRPVDTLKVATSGPCTRPPRR